MSIANIGGRPYSPSALFVTGANGIWYEPSDPTTLFTTSTGTTPCAVPGSGSQVLVGLMLDKSQGLVLGSELLADSGFNNAASWQSNAGVTISGGEAIWNTATNSVYVRQPLITTANTYYEFTVVCSSYTAGTVFVGIGAGGTNLTSFPINAVGTVTFRINVEANSGTVWLLTPTGGAQLSITSFSVRQVSGNHAIAFNDTTARPELSARVNLLTYSEQFDNSYWTKVASTIAANTGIAPDGTNTADKLIENAATTIHYVSRITADFTAGVTYTLSAYVKAAERQWVVLGFLNESNRSVWFGVANGVVGTMQSNVATASIQAVGNGWYRCVMTTTSASAQPYPSIAIASADGTSNYTGDGTSGIFIWGADLRPANIGSAIPSYQRIADQYTYDSNGFPTYLRFDGVDDSMYTPASINFSGTDKMSVFAGVRKLSDVSAGCLVELSSNYSANDGTFTGFAPGSNFPTGYDWPYRGTATVATPGFAAEAPTTNVISSAYNISAPSAVIRSNGAQVSSATTGAGTGNFGNYPLFIGRRNNATFPLNGHLYSLITVGTQLQSGSITATEQYVAGKTGVQI
jgi:hypothetical protein